MKMWIFLVSIFLFHSSCAVLRVYEVKETTKVFDEALVKTDASTAKVDADFQNKSSIWEGIGKKNPSGKEEPLALAAQQHQGMKSHRNRLKKHQSKLHSLHDQFVHLAADSKQIDSRDGRWDRASQIRQEFESEAKLFNSSQALYSQASNTFAKTLTDNNLFTQIKPGDLVQRINEAIKRINQVDRELAQDLDGKEAAFNKFKSRLGPTQQAREREMFLLIEDMSEIRKQIQLKSRRLEQIRDDFARKNKGITAIRSIDPTWSQVEEIKMDYDLARQQVEALSQNYAKKAESFALSLKEGTEESRQ